MVVGLNLRRVGNQEFYITPSLYRALGEGEQPFLEPGRLDQWKVVCLMIIMADGMVTKRSHLISKQFYVGLCKSLFF